MCTSCKPELTWSVESKELTGTVSAYEMILSQRARRAILSWRRHVTQSFFCFFFSICPHHCRWFSAVFIFMTSRVFCFFFSEWTWFTANLWDMSSVTKPNNKIFIFGSQRHASLHWNRREVGGEKDRGIPTDTDWRACGWWRNSWLSKVSQGELNVKPASPTADAEKPWKRAGMSARGGSDAWHSAKQ